ncbi:hypothetical protein [Ilumatobacter sp.]|uniref:hypothetical protein n=1 Tax=Ilumatobacter sp. TaxID=1967498 RepID=UPI003AF99C06
MFTTGSKLLIGSAAVAAIAAVAYGVLQGGALGTIGLISAAVALSFLAGLNAFIRDSNVSAMDHDAFATSAAAQATARPSLWPLLVAVGATSLTLGLVTTTAYFVVGLVLMLAGGVEWLIQDWSERASADPAYNDEVREVMADPLELPVAAAIVAGIVVYAFSRIMLGLPSKSATVAAFAVVAAVILAVAAFIGMKRSTSGTSLAGAFSLAAIVLIGAGTFAGLNGEREIEEHHSTAYIAEENECGTEETEADENASQTVAAKSNVAAEVTYDGSALTADVPGYDGEFDALTLPRSNPSNVIFVNESGEAARLVIEMHPDEVDGEPVGPERLCTALVEEGGSHFLTIEFDRPSIAVDEGYEFTVAGSDTSLEVVVP